MTHEELQLNLPDYLAGRLPAHESRFLEAHLDTCEECSNFVTDLRALPDLITLHGEALFDEHLDHAMFERLLGGAAGPEEERLRRHLAVCAPCGLQLNPLADPPVRRAESVENAHSRTRRSLPGILKVSGLVAAGLIVGVLAAPLLKPPAPARDGPIELPVLQPVTRSAGRVTRIAVRAGQSAVVIAIPVDTLDMHADDERILVQVTTAAHEVIYGLEKPAGEVRRTSVSGILPLMLESRHLPPGSYEVSIKPSTRAGESIAVLLFEIVVGDEGD